MTHSVNDRKPLGLEPASNSSDDEKPQTNGTTKSEGRVPGFIAKAFEIFSNISYAPYCGWSRNGDTIMIHNIAEFAARVLPKYFKHSNYASFVRQLNMYDFHKTCSNPQIAEFQHPNFIHSRPDLLRMIKRKSRRDAAVAQQEKLALAASMSANLNMANHNMRPPTMERRGSPDGRVSPLTATASYHQHQHHHTASCRPRSAVTSHSDDVVAPVHAEVIPAATNLAGGAEPTRSAHVSHGAKRKATNFDADLDRPAKHHSMTHSNNHCVTNAAMHGSHRAAAPGSTAVNSSLASDNDWKIAIERHLLGFQAEIQSLRQENLNLRRSLNETDRRMQMMLGFTNNSRSSVNSKAANTLQFTVEKVPADERITTSGRAPGSLALSKKGEDALAFTPRAHVRDVNHNTVQGVDAKSQPLQKQIQPYTQEDEYDLSPDTVEEYKYEMSPDTSPEWTGLLNDVDYDVDSEGIIGSLFNL